MDYKKVAQQVVDNIGGKSNISYMEHCSTRLRFTLVDNSKANVAELEKIEGVVGVRQNAQTQVIIGNEVNEVYAEVQKYVGELNSEGTTNSNGNKPSFGAIFLDFLTGVFQPLVPAIAGGGVLKSLLLLFSLLGWMSKDSSTYQILNQIGDAPLYFLPLLVAMSTAKKLNVNQLVAVSAVGALVLPNMTTMLAEGTNLFGFGLQNIAYSYQVFPAILTVLLYSVVEKFFTKYTPKPIRIFFVPMMSLVVTVPIALLILGPLGYNFGQLFATVILFIYGKLGWVATGLLAAILPFMVATGMHKAMLPYAIATMGELNKEILYLPASLAHNIAESGASFAVALRTKDQKLRATAISSGISALFGITEPALYGVTLQHKSVLYSVVTGSLFGGIFIGIMGVEAFALVGPGLASMTMYTNPDNPSNLMWAFAGFVVSFLIAFIAAFVMFRDKVETTSTKEMFIEESVEMNQEKPNKIVFNAPNNGKLIPLTAVKDEVFSTKMVGDGFGIIPSEGILFAPVNGTIEMIYETKHAIAMTAENGAEILFHIGIDTVQLNGEPFSTCINVGDKVLQGDVLVKFDQAAIEKAGFDTTVITVVTNKDQFNFDFIQSEKEVTIEESVLSVERKV